MAHQKFNLYFIKSYANGPTSISRVVEIVSYSVLDVQSWTKNNFYPLVKNALFQENN